MVVSRQAAFGAAALAIVSLVAGCRLGPRPVYERIDLGTFDVPDVLVGDVAGPYVVGRLGTPEPPTASGTVPVRWVDGEPQVLADADGTADFVTADGQVAGTLPDDAGRPGLAVWRADGSLARPFPGVQSWLADQNERGQVAGHRLATGPSGTTFRAFLWDDGVETPVAELPWTPPSGPFDSIVVPTAVDVSEAGDVAGRRIDWAGMALGRVVVLSSFVWHGGVLQDIPNPPGLVADAVSVNSSGTVAGLLLDGPGTIRGGFVWHGTAMAGLAPLPGGHVQSVLRIGDSGGVVGVSLDAAGNRRAVVWLAGQPFDLGTLGGPSSTPVDVDAQGRIVGVADMPGGEAHAVLWHGGGITDLGPAAEAYALAVDEGLVAGHAVVPGGLAPTTWVPRAPAPIAPGPTVAGRAGRAG
jgi:probable HAF family extracellular repeat protein